MVDLKITNTGDLLIEKKKQLPSFHLFWKNNRLPSFRLRWKQGLCKTKNDNHGFVLKFFTGEAEKKNISKAIYEDDEIRQRILMQLRTEYNSIKNIPQLGSYLYKAKHEDLTQKRTVEQIKDIIKEVVEEYLDEPEIRIEHAYGTGAFYCQNLNVYIYEKNKLFYNFTMEDLS